MQRADRVLTPYTTGSAGAFGGTIPRQSNTTYIYIRWQLGNRTPRRSPIEATSKLEQQDAFAASYGVNNECVQLDATLSRNMLVVGVCISAAGTAFSSYTIEQTTMARDPTCEFTAIVGSRADRFRDWI